MKDSFVRNSFKKVKKKLADQHLEDAQSKIEGELVFTLKILFIKLPLDTSALAAILSSL